MVDLLKDNKIPIDTCFLGKAYSTETDLWHRRLGHVNIKTLNKQAKMNLVRGLPNKNISS